MSVFAHESYSLGLVRDGRALIAKPMTTSAADELGSVCAQIDPWKHYGISAKRLATSFAARGSQIFSYRILAGENLVGGAIMEQPWLLGPYLRLLAVVPAAQGAGVGKAVLTWMEARARQAKQRNAWLCVSAFNAPARAFYAANGWTDAALLPELVADGVDELLMRKRLS